MRSKKIGGKVHVGFYMEKDLWDKVAALAKKNEVTALFIVRRVLTSVVESGRIPWPTVEEIENREREKFGEEAVPTFDGETSVPVAKAALKEPAPPAQ